MSDQANMIQTAEDSIPQLREGVSDVRKCSFKPEEHFIEMGFPGKDEKSYYLEVKWRVFWFNLYCQEKGVESYSIEEEPATMLGTNMVQARCIVKMNGAIAGAGVGGYLLNNDPMYAVQMASTIAKGRALANAGFGPVFSSAMAAESGGQEIPCDAGVRTSEFFVRNDKNPMVMQPKTGEKPEPKAEEAPKAEEKPVKKAGRRTSTKSTAAVAETNAENGNTNAEHKVTREEAFRYIVPIGKHKGDTLGDVIGKDSGWVDWIIRTERFNGTEVQAMCKIARGVE